MHIEENIDGIDTSTLELYTGIFYYGGHQKMTYRHLSLQFPIQSCQRSPKGRFGAKHSSTAQVQFK